MTEIEKLGEVLRFVKQTFIGKDEIVELLGIGLLARENVFLLGPPGTAKSAIVRLFSQCIEDGKNFEYLLTRFTEPNEVFGPFDVRKLREGELVTNTDGMLPEASLVFLDEIFNANSAILNSLLTALNEKLFRRGKEIRKIPALMFIAASNLIPEDDALNALLDRFLIRAKCDYVAPEQLNEVLLSGWELEGAVEKEKPVITSDNIRFLQSQCRKVDLQKIRKIYIEVILSLRNTGIKISDRRAVKLQSLIAASALICNRKEAISSDLWVLKYIWDTEDQVEILEGLINNVIKSESTSSAHSLAHLNKIPNAEELAREVKLLAEQWQAQPNLDQQNVIKDKLRYIQNRCDWARNEKQKEFIQNEIDALWRQMLLTT